MARQVEDMDIEEKLNEIEETAGELYDLYRENKRMHLWSLSVNVLSLVVVCLSPFKKLSSYLTCINYFGVLAMFSRALYQCRKQHKIHGKKRKCEETLESICVMLNNDVNFGSDEYCETILYERQVNLVRRVLSTDILGKNFWLLVMGQQMLNIYSLIFLKQPVHFRLCISDNVRNASRFCDSIIVLTARMKFKQLKELLLKYTTSKKDLTKTVKNGKMRSCEMVGRMFYTNGTEYLQCPYPMPEYQHFKLLKLIQKGLVKSDLQGDLIDFRTTDTDLSSQIKKEIVTMKMEIGNFNREINTIIQSAKHCLDIAEVQSDILSSEDISILTELGQNFTTNGSDLLENLYDIKSQIGSVQEAANVDMAVNPAQKEKLISDVTVLLDNVIKAIITSSNLKQCSIQLNAQNASRLHLNQWTTKLSTLKVDKFSVNSAAERAIQHIMNAKSKRSEICDSICNLFSPFLSYAFHENTTNIYLEWIPLWRHAVQRFGSAYETSKMTMGAIIEGTEAVEYACESLDNLSVDTIEKNPYCDG